MAAPHIGTFTLDISEATEEAPAKSEVLNVAGITWQIICPTKGKPDRFTVYCNELCDDRLWLCKAKIGWQTTENKGEDKWSKLTETAPNFWLNHHNCFIWQFKKGNERPTAIKYRIEITWVAKEKTMPPLDTDLKLKARGVDYVVPVNQLCLATHSGLLQEHFFGAGKRNSGGGKLRDGRKTYEIHEEPTFDVGRFRFMASAVQVLGPLVNEGVGLWACVWRQTREFEAENIALLRMAHKYRVPVFVEFAQNLLIKTGPGTMTLLKLADELCVEGLMRHCLDSIDAIEYGREIAKNCEIREQLQPLTRHRLDAKIEQSAKRYSRKRSLPSTDTEDA